MTGERVLVVEDDAAIMELVSFNLERENYSVAKAESGEQALREVAQSPPDLLLLDLMLPGTDGLEVCRRLKADPATEKIPIVMVTAKGEESDVVTGLELGADDYVSKPFRPRELMARVRAVLRRVSEPPENTTAVVRIHGLKIHPGRRRVLMDGEPVELTFTEFEILHLLARRAGWVFTRYQIVDAVRGKDYAVTDRAVDVQIFGLRQKLGKAGKCIETVRGVGYRMKD